MKTIIYCIFTETNIPIYIGKTIQKMDIRKNFHKRRFGNNITIMELDYVDDWKFWEKYWIEQFKVWGYSLLNRNKGGGGPTKHTKQTRELMSQQRKGKTFSDEYRKKLSEAAKHKIFTEEHRRKIGEKSIGRKFSIEAKLKMSEAKKGKDTWNKGKSLSNEHKQKIKETLLRNKLNP